jgi:mono/diheme cytochrome c family protein
VRTNARGVLVWVVALFLLTIAAMTMAAATPERAANSPQVLYRLHCSGCHGADGMGDPRVDVPPFPGFVGSFLRDQEGRRYVTNVGGVMSAGLNDRDTALVLNWVMENFGRSSLPPGAFRSFDAAEVRQLRDNRPADAVALRRQIAQRLKQQGIVLPDYPWP